jgi:hypothetical protein
MRHTAEPNPPYHPGRPGLDERIATSDEVRLCPPKPERDNPLEAPIVLLDIADSSATDILEVVIQNLRDLPREYQETFEPHFDTRLIDDLSVLYSALTKLRRNELPTQDELNLLTAPREVFEGLPEALRNCAHREKFPEAVGILVEKQIAAPLADLAHSVLTDPALGLLVGSWEEEVYPDPDDTVDFNSPQSP